MLKTQNKRGQHLPRLMCPVSVLPFCSRRGKENQLMSEVRTVERNIIPHRDLCSTRLTLRWRHNEHDGVLNHQLTIVYSIAYSDADQRKHQSSATLAFVWGIHRWPVNSPHKRPVTRKVFPLDDVIMNTDKCQCRGQGGDGKLVIHLKRKVVDFYTVLVLNYTLVLAINIFHFDFARAQENTCQPEIITMTS